MHQCSHSMVDPEEACDNLERLAKVNMVGEYGFFEAIDYFSVSSAAGPIQYDNKIIYGTSPGNESSFYGISDP